MALRRIMRALGVPPSRLQRLAAVVGERVGRLKPNGAVLHRSRLTDLVEIEAIALGVEGKVRLWRTLDVVVPDLTELDGVDLSVLAQRAQNQVARLEALHDRAADALTRVAGRE